MLAFFFFKQNGKKKNPDRPKTKLLFESTFETFAACPLSGSFKNNSGHRNVSQVWAFERRATPRSTLQDKLFPEMAWEFKDHKHKTMKNFTCCTFSLWEWSKVKSFHDKEGGKQTNPHSTLLLLFAGSVQLLKHGFINVHAAALRFTSASLTNCKSAQFLPHHQRQINSFIIRDKVSSHV